MTGQFCAYCHSAPCELRNLCWRCSYQLPAPSRDAYAAGDIGTLRAIELLRLWRESVRVLRGGQHTDHN